MGALSICFTALVAIATDRKLARPVFLPAYFRAYLYRFINQNDTLYDEIANILAHNGASNNDHRLARRKMLDYTTTNSTTIFVQKLQLGTLLS